MSLIQLAQWHSSSKFDAEQMMRFSGKFDFTAPQFYHDANRRLQFEIQLKHKVVHGEYLGLDVGDFRDNNDSNCWLVTTYNSSLAKLIIPSDIPMIEHVFSDPSNFLIELRKAI